VWRKRGELEGGLRETFWTRGGKVVVFAIGKLGKLRFLVRELELFASTGQDVDNEACRTSVDDDTATFALYDTDVKVEGRRGGN
jgi:hypothetical protein